MNIEDIFLKFALMGAQWVLWVLVALSVVCLAIMIERTVAFIRLSSGLEAIYLRLREWLRRDDVSGAITYLEQQKGVEALVATGVGLLVAIPAVVAFNVLSRRVRRISTHSEATEHLVLAQLKGDPLPTLES